MSVSSGLHAYFQLVVKKIIHCQLAHKPPTSTKYILDLDFIKIRLFDKVVPKTCHNFRELCTHNQGFGYAGSSIDHVVRGFGLYGGDVVERVQAEQPHDEPYTGLAWNGKVESFKKPQYLEMPKPRLGECGRSVYGASMREMVYEDETYFPDENHTIIHDRPGIITMAGHGPDTNSSRFLILTAPARWLDGKQVAFGEVVEGLETVQEIDQICGSQCGHPRHLVEIVQSGVVEGEESLPQLRTLEELNYREPIDPLAYTKQPVYIE